MRIDPRGFVAPGAWVMGDVTLEAEASVWYGCVLRGDMDRIVIGAQTNIQDGSIVHVDAGLPALIGARVGVGHRAILHGCVVEDECLEHERHRRTHWRERLGICRQLIGDDVRAGRARHAPPPSLITCSPADLGESRGQGAVTIDALCVAREGALVLA